MLVWINGPFGGGKTQTAYELNRRLPGSVVCDPEHVGFGLHRMTPPALRTDFQRLPAWRQGVREVLDLALTRHDGVVIAPMTLVEPAYYDEILTRLRQAGHEVRHFALLAGRETVLRRLRGRSLSRSLKREAFAVARLEECLERLRRPEFAEQVDTDGLTVPQVAERIADAAGLRLTPGADGRLRGWLRRTGVSLRHIRLD
ncbi:AAA family ATPase [Actinomadura sp. ATCC 31491]|uniref:AAA family ATPase n=1 Tax=Actinomadura luzonensis TaxID=2805427 RepID=A0ABT0FSU6_9ACTN|nr:AAA family ATPase [Actinomadura luzonensis]MCK2215404.1 AAA family ATPase [Actinomadura luzonensis]